MPRAISFIQCAVTAFFPLFALAGCDFCADEIAQQAVSPSGRLSAVIVTRNCGALAGDYNSAVFLIPPGTRIPRKAGIVFSADSGHGRAPSAPNGALPISVTWSDATRLRITYDSRIRVFAHETRFGDVQIEYAVENTPKT